MSEESDRVPTSCTPRGRHIKMKARNNMQQDVARQPFLTFVPPRRATRRTSLNSLQHPFRPKTAVLRSSTLGLVWIRSTSLSIVSVGV